MMYKKPQSHKIIQISLTKDTYLKQKANIDQSEITWASGRIKSSTPGLFLQQPVLVDNT